MQKRLRLEWDQEANATQLGPLVANLDHVKFSTVNAIGKFLFVYGGSLGHRSQAMVRYDVVNKVWVNLTIPNELPIRSMHSSTLIGDGLFIFGGYSNRSTVRTMFRFDVLMNTCEQLECSGDIPSPRRGHCTEFFDQLDVMLLYGGGADSRKYEDLYSFSVANCSWKKLDTKGRSPEGRNRTGNAKVGLKWYIVGGVTRAGYSTDVFVLNLAPSVPVWSKLFYPGLPRTRMDMPVVYIEGSLILFAPSNYILDSRGENWEIAGANGTESTHLVTGSAPQMNGGFVATLSDKIYVFTGNALYQPHLMTYEIVE